MLLDRIDIDAHGPLHRVELGPLSEGLNVVLAPEGAGKTAVVRFIRDSLVTRDYPMGMMNSSTGRVVWADRHGLIHCRREQDGTPRGRRTIEFESRGEYPLRYDSLDHSWIAGAADTTDASLALRSIQLPEPLVDGVITDTSVTHVARIVSACLCLGLDGPPSGRPSSSDGDRVATDSAGNPQHPQRHERLRAELAEVVAELASLSPVTEDIRALTARRETLARRLEQTGVESVAAGDGSLDWLDREAIVAELRRLDERLAAQGRLEGLRRRQAKLEQLLGATESAASPEAPLARESSRWLVRLSAGRLQHIEWNREGDGRWQQGREVPTPAESRRMLGVRLDGREESDCSAADRALAVLAVRMAAADLLARSGRAVPLVVETYRELFGFPEESSDGLAPAFSVAPSSRQPEPAEAAGRHPSQRMAFGTDPIASALADFASAGRQLVVLTSNPAMTDALDRAGGRRFRLHAEPVVHPHRPLWKSQYARESYVGPHPHTGGEPSADPMWASDYQINRDFDAAWREAYGIDDRPAAFQPNAGERTPATERPTAESAWRDGVYYGHRYTTHREPSRPGDPTRHRDVGDWETTAPHSTPAMPRGSQLGLFERPPAPQADVSEREVTSPFFLTVDSPIDQAPSIDAVIAARLRGLGVTHVIHLMKEDANRLADTLGVANVNAAAIRRWQSECRLVCRVPQLRGFDARILVGCGISDPARLAAMPPMELLERVEAFLATERGQRILLSGTSYELCRITSWIASANRSAASQSGRRLSDSGTAGSGRERRDAAAGAPSSSREKSRRPGRSRRADSARDHNTEFGVGLRLRRNEVPGSSKVESADRQAGEDSNAPGRANAAEEVGCQLDRECPVEDLPAIGIRMAERLVEVGVEWIDDLLQADPKTLAAKLHHRRVDADVVRRWQSVATLLCRVPELHGHEARLLVNVGVTTPEALAEQEAEQLLAEIEPLASSREGRRILRGKPTPGLEQVHDWIASAARNPTRQAA